MSVFGDRPHSSQPSKVGWKNSEPGLFPAFPDLKLMSDPHPGPFVLLLAFGPEGMFQLAFLPVKGKC